MPVFRPLFTAVFPILAFSAFQASAQTPNEALRNTLRVGLRNHGFGNQLQGLTGFGAVPGITGSNLTIDGSGQAGDTDLSRLNVPFSRNFKNLGPGDWSLRLELDVGWLQSETRYDGLLGGTSFESDADSRIDAFSAIAGAGLEMPLNDYWTFTPIALLGYSYLEDDSSFSGPGAGDFASLTQGILFNYDAHELLYGGALQFEYNRTLSNGINLLWRLRYNHLFADTLDSSDKALDGNGDFGVFTNYFEADGPTPCQFLGRKIRWIGFAGNTIFTGDTKDALGFDYLIEVGGGIEFVDRSIFKGLEGVSLRVSYVFGEDVSGWGFGGKLEF